MRGMVACSATGLTSGPSARPTSAAIFVSWSLVCPSMRRRVGQVRAMLAAAAAIVYFGALQYALLS